jgi:hypothetical protein
MYKRVYSIIYLFSLYLFILNYKKIYKTDKSWFYKTLFISISGITMLYSLYKTNEIVNNLGLPILLILNLAILIYITLNNKYTFINLLPLLGIVYIIYTFNIKDFSLNKGKLVKPNHKWIYQYIPVLIIYYMFSNLSMIKLSSKIGNVLLVLYPLLFPLNEYFIHRVFSLCLMVQFAWI